MFYVSNDGKHFDTAKECRAWEAGAEARETEARRQEEEDALRLVRGQAEDIVSHAVCEYPCAEFDAIRRLISSGRLSEDMIAGWARQGFRVWCAGIGLGLAEGPAQEP